MTGLSSGFERELRELRRKQIGMILRRRWGDLPGAAGRLRLLRDSLAAGSPAARRCLLDSPLLGGWVQDVLFWRSALDRSTRLLPRGGTPSALTRLFGQIARTEYLLEMVPSGRLDLSFPRRVHSCALRVLAERLGDLPRILWPHLHSSRRVRIQFRADENTDEGSPAGRIRLGMTPAVLHHAGALTERGVIGLLHPNALVLPGSARITRQETIPGTAILLGNRLVSTSRSLRVGGSVPGLGGRLARALALVDLAWPAAGEEIRRRTWLIVPLVEPGTVSYSHLARPGISYLNVWRGTILDLSDDLLHETAHHRLHARQEVAALSLPDEEPRYYSPWRRSLRPLNGILHGTYTFLFRAELLLRLSRISGVASPSRRRRIGREARREMRRCAHCLGDLAGAGRAGLLTPAGRALVHSMARRLRRLREGRLSRGFEIGIF